MTRAGSFVTTWWRQRSASEQRTLRFGGLFLLLVFLVFLILLPGLDEQQRLQTQWPMLQQQEAELRLLLEQRPTRTVDATAAEVDTWIEQARQSSLEYDLDLQISLDAEAIVVSFEQGPSDRLFVWLQNTPLPSGMAWSEGSLQRMSSEPALLKGRLIAR